MSPRRNREPWTVLLGARLALSGLKEGFTLVVGGGAGGTKLTMPLALINSPKGA